METNNTPVIPMFSGSLADARRALRSGHKITHQYFTDDEHIELINGTPTFEDGVEVPDWWWEKDFVKAGGWSIKK